ncbi:hypothetical protein BUALT_Bualt19G0063100 [Buddleja alternifolia]|uniref:SWIM-type domain-containing protein n=1 Tax=Buddleja alternifolia TaxID=168488 RepID=A0AAV6W1Y5_9LAMI|nr:hypothetical protein BUALT_Bualt19G0063100 [Buddleja alternifolia]
MTLCLHYGGMMMKYGNISRYEVGSVFKFDHFDIGKICIEGIRKFCKHMDLPDFRSIYTKDNNGFNLLSNDSELDDAYVLTLTKNREIDVYLDYDFDGMRKEDMDNEGDYDMNSDDDKIEDVEGKDEGIDKGKGECADNDYMFMSDKQKGLIIAFQQVFPNSDHRFCVRHLHSNFKTAGLRGLAFKDALWKTAMATTLNEFERKMDEMRALNEETTEWFNDKPPEQWSLDTTQYTVDLEKRICTCRKWELSGIPCKHALSAIYCQGLQVEDFVADCYSVDTYKKVYGPAIMPVNGRSEWVKTGFVPPLPPNSGRSVGKPPIARRVEADEMKTKKKKRSRGKPKLVNNPYKLKRQQKTCKCSKCGEEGHNIKSCPLKNRGDDDAQDGFSQVSVDLGSNSDIVGAPSVSGNAQINLKGKSSQVPVSKRKQNLDKATEATNEVHNEVESISASIPVAFKPSGKTTKLTNPRSKKILNVDQGKRNQKKSKTGGTQSSNLKLVDEDDEFPNEEMSSGFSPGCFSAPKAGPSMFSQLQQGQGYCMEKRNENSFEDLAPTSVEAFRIPPNDQ